VTLKTPSAIIVPLVAIVAQKSVRASRHRRRKTITKPVSAIPLRTSRTESRTAREEAVVPGLDERDAEAERDVPRDARLEGERECGDLQHDRAGEDPEDEAVRPRGADRAVEDRIVGDETRRAGDRHR
jgi:hypothetical protein